jgi:hypothetical protein
VEIVLVGFDRDCGEMHLPEKVELFVRKKEMGGK